MPKLSGSVIRFVSVAFAVFVTTACGDFEDGAKHASSSETGDADANALRFQGVRIFGDSIFTSGGDMIKQELEPLLQTPITSHAVAGAVMTQIKDRYLSLRDQGMRTAIFDGGGNDVLGARGECQNQLSGNCRNIIDRVGASILEMMTDMVAHGVSNIVYLSCYYPVSWNSGFVQAVDYGFEVASEACAASGANCIVVDPREAFRGRSDLFEWDGIHPNRNGARTIANLIAEAMNAAAMEP